MHKETRFGISIRRSPCQPQMVKRESVTVSLFRVVEENSVTQMSQCISSSSSKAGQPEESLLTNASMISNLQRCNFLRCAELKVPSIISGDGAMKG